MQPYVATKQWKDGFGAGETRITASDLTRIEAGISAATQGVTSVESKIDEANRLSFSRANAAKGEAIAAAQALIPIGAILPSVGGPAPAGWAVCNGQAISRTTYAELFRLIGTKYGSTSTDNFKVPDLSDRFIVGVGPRSAIGDVGGEASVTLTTGQLPVHSHDITGKADQARVSGVGMYKSNVSGGTGWQVLSTTENGSTSGLVTTSVGSGQPHENRPPFFVLQYIIRTGLPAGRI